MPRLTAFFQHLPGGVVSAMPAGPAGQVLRWAALTAAGLLGHYTVAGDQVPGGGYSGLVQWLAGIGPWWAVGMARKPLAPPSSPGEPGFRYVRQERPGPATHALAPVADPDSAFLAMAETVPDILFMVTPDGACEYINQRFYDFTGTPEGSALGHGWAGVLHPGERGAHLLQWQATLQSPTLAGIRGRIRAADGRYQWFFARLRPVTDGQGRVIRWFGAASNIHSLTQSEEQLRLLNESLEQRVSERTAALRDSEARLRAIFDSAVEGILTMDEEGTIESANPAALSCFGYAAGELTGRKLTALLPDSHLPPDGRDAAESFLPGSGTQAGVERELIGVRREGFRFPAHLSVIGFQADGERRFAGFVRDLTIQKRLEHLILEISEREQRRIGGDLHDGLGQELTALSMLNSVLQKDLEAKHLPEAATSARIAGMLDVARRQLYQTVHGLLPVAAEPGGLMSGLERHAESCRETLGCHCHFHCPVPVLMQDAAHATHLFRIAQEAIHNAVRHGRAEKITIRLLQADPGYVVLEVEDAGTGISGLMTGHSGVGLRSMKYRAEAMQGRLEVHRPACGGTLIRCVVPGSPPPNDTPCS
jgi:two-component system sensor kinase FixL